MKVNYIFLTVFFLILSQASYCQVSNKLNFKNCESFEDSCLIIGNQFLDDLKNRNFSDLPELCSDKILFRALVPAGIETSNDPEEIANTFKGWFGRDGMENFKVEKSAAEMVVDCLHISYVLTLTYKQTLYKIQQQIYCEVESGKINKLSLMCSGFQKPDM